jgi:N-acetyl-alpha-D-glucosaminyl L-malate synthase BshA
LVGKDPSFEPVISFCINASDAVTAVSESLMKDTYTHFETKRKIHVIPNFIQSKAELPVINMEKRRHYAQDDELILCHISNFRPVKRITDVVRIFEKVQEKLPARLLLAGDGPDRAIAERLARDLGICQKITFTGKVRETSPILELSDLFLLPSETESFGLAALEAMAEGVPVVSSNTGGIPEVNIDGFSGFTSNVGDIESMAQNAIRILENKETHQLFRKHVLEQAKRFDLAEILPLYEDLYESVLKGHPETMRV